MKKIYKVIYSQLALQDLADIYKYIRFSLKAPIDNYMVFYRIDENLSSVSIIRIFYSGKNIDDILKHTNN